MRRIIVFMPAICMLLINCATIGNIFKAAETECGANEKECHYNKGVKYISEEQYDRAIEELIEALALDRRYIDAMISLGIANQKLGKYSEALEWFEEVFILSPSNIDAFKNTAIVFKKQNRKEKAVEYLKKAAGTGTFDPDVYYMLGEIYYSDEAYAKSFPLLEKAWCLYSGKETGRMYDAASMMSVCLSEFGDWKNALRFVKIARKKYADDEKLNAVEKAAIEGLNIHSNDEYADLKKAAELISRNPVSLLSSEYYFAVYSFLVSVDKRFIDEYRYDLRWLSVNGNEKWQNYLLGSYIAGDLNTQVTGGHESLCPINAIKALVNTYSHIKNIHDDLFIPGLEEFAAMQENNNPFFRFLVYLHTRNRWGHDRNNRAAVFRNIRKELGDRFETEIVKFAGNDVHRVYDCGIYLITGVYLNGDEPAYRLALKLFENGIARYIDPETKNRDEMYMISLQVSIRIEAAITYAKIGEPERGRELKNEVSKLVKTYPHLAGSFPAMDEEDRKIYEDL